ncbi:hypothetical protein ACQP00_16650 [Dactylosporangium sp. CS-047395]|uniref:hypothetical protein n=1 Tax=Dactylosporangium sp. CS-047395 TaxID=3239936 RepID=UPI003D8FDBC7
MRMRATAVSLALSVCALLLGLTMAHHAVPGDTFQVLRAAHGQTVAVAEVRDTAAESPVAGEGGDEPRFADGTPESEPDRTHAGWSGEAAGCRGPPNS